MLVCPPRPTVFPYTTLFRSLLQPEHVLVTCEQVRCVAAEHGGTARLQTDHVPAALHMPGGYVRSEEHTSELQSRGHLVCRLLLEKKKTILHMRGECLCQ